MEKWCKVLHIVEEDAFRPVPWMRSGEVTSKVHIFLKDGSLELRFRKFQVHQNRFLMHYAEC